MGTTKHRNLVVKVTSRQAATLAKRPEAWLIGCVETHFRICTRKDFDSYNQYINISISQYTVYIYIIYISLEG